MYANEEKKTDEKRQSMKQNLYEKLKQYGASDAYPFHMPGHKRRLGAVPEVRAIDITEIDGFDNLHHAEEILKEAQERAAKLYNSEETYYLINGSTCGLLSAVFACTSQRGKILMARNCHKAVYHAAELRELQTVYLYPKHGKGNQEWQINGVIDPQDVQRALEKDPEIEAVLITSPTYEGIVSDVEKIAEIAHSCGKPLIVDEAHGAHFGFHPYFPQNSVKLGADIVIHSLHKTLPSLTQTALLHVNGRLADRMHVKKYLGMFQTSSPSYVLMAGMDECVCMMEKDGRRLFDEFAGRLQEVYKKTAGLQYVHVLDDSPCEKEAADGLYRDLSKIIVRAEGRSGKWLADVLRKKYQLEVEMETDSYVVLLTSVADIQEGFDRLIKALKEIEKMLADENRHLKKKFVFINNNIRNPQCMTIAQADGLKKETVLIEESAGRISGEYLYLYPPGIPRIVPGEEITPELVRQIELYRREGLSLQGLDDYEVEKIKCIDRKE